MRGVNSKRLLERFLRYVRCDSESTHERAFCELLERELLEMGVRVERDEVGEKCGSDGFDLRAFLPGEGEPLLFSAHLDTVSPGENIEPVVSGGTVTSKGDTVLGADDKAGVAAVMEALCCITKEAIPHRPVEVLFSVCEEIGLLGAKYADYSAFRSKQAVVLDSSRLGAIVNRGPAIFKLHVEITGRSAHAGMAPEKGAHALKAAAEAVANIPCGHVGEDSVMNVGSMQCSGKTNIVPSFAAFDMEIRSFSEEKAQSLKTAALRAVAAACQKYGTTYRAEEERDADVLYVPEDSAVVRALLEAHAAERRSATLCGTFGGCDATWLNHNGIEAVNIGTGMQNVHGTSESIEADTLTGTANIVLCLMRGER